MFEYKGKIPYYSGKRWGLYCATVIFACIWISLWAARILTLNTRTGAEIYDYLAKKDS